MNLRLVYIGFALLVIACNGGTEVHESQLFNRQQPLSIQSNTWVDGRVVNRLNGMGLPNAKVSLIGTQYTAITDQLGRYRLPYRPGFDWVSVSIIGFSNQTTKIGTVTGAWPIDVADNDIQDYIARRSRPDLDSDLLDDPDLRPQARESLLKRQLGVLDWLTTPTPQTNLFKQAVQPPTTIRIYRRGPENNSCQGRVQVIPLEEYVKGVVPHEWIPSWTDESLRAGSIAARSYAWGWILMGGKYDCADLDDTTRSQVYKDDRNERASELVDSTRGVGIIRAGQIITTEYSAENGDPTAFGVEEPLCTGREVFGHGRGMCQWGTQRWSSQRGMTAEWMVEHYFPNATVSGQQPPSPNVKLKQRFSRVDEVECPDPETMYECADFVQQGWSNNLYDLFMGGRMLFRIELTNTGGTDAANVRVAVRLPNDFLRANWVESDDSVLRQPEDFFEHTIARIQAGSTQTISFEIVGIASSVTMGAPAQIKTWVKAIEGLYLKPNWNDPPETNRGQTFNGGDLKLLTEIDVYNPRQWFWDYVSPATDQWEGWVAGNEHTRLKSDGGLMIEHTESASGNEVLVIDSPFLPSFASPVGGIRLERQPTASGRLHWRGQNEDFSDERSVVIGAEREIQIPTVFGDITPFQIQLRFETATRIKELALLDDVDASPEIVEADSGTLSMASGGRTAAPSVTDSMETTDQTLDMDIRMTDSGPVDDNPTQETEAARPSTVRRVYMEGGCATWALTPVSTESLFLGILLCLRLTRPRRRRTSG